MSRLFILLIIIFVTIVSCDGRDRKHKTNKEVLKEKKLLDSFSEIVKYIPETYTEVVTDTILSNGFRVKIKTYTEMQDNVINEFVIDTIKYKFYYRNYSGKMEVFYNDTPILNETINKPYFNKNEEKEFWDFAIMGGISIDEHNSTKNEAQISVLYCIPESEICKDFKIIVDRKGYTTIKELDQKPIH